MEVVLEQFIPSDKPKRISNILQKISIVFLVVGLMIVFCITNNRNSANNSSINIFCGKLLYVYWLWVWVI